MAFLERGFLSASLTDWLTCVACLVAAILSWRASKAAQSYEASRGQLFWAGSAAFLTCLGINELFDFQTLVPIIGKAVAKEAGWYEHRRTVQLVFFAVVSIAAIAATLALIRFVKGQPKAIKMALAGHGLIGLFALLRAAEFNHLDEIFRSAPATFDFGFVLEFVGLAKVAMSSLAYRRSVELGEPKAG